MFSRIVVAAGSAAEDALLAAAKCVSAPNGELHSFHVNSTRFGDTVDALLAHCVAAKADLLVLGARKHVMARRVAMLAPCSVLTVPDGSVLTLDRLVVPVDFSETSAEALAESVRIGQAGSSNISAIAVETEEDDIWLDWKDEPRLSQAALEEFVSRVAGPQNSVACLIEPARGFDSDEPGGIQNVEGANTASTIVETAERLRATLIVAGMRGRTRASAVLFGSVAEKIVQLSHVPVLAVRPRGERLDLLGAIQERLRDSHRQFGAG